MHLHGKEKLEDETSKIFNLFLEETGWTNPANFRAVCMEVTAAVEDNEQGDFFLYDLDIVAGFTGQRLRGRVSRITLLLYGYYVLIVTFAMSPLSTFFSKPIVVHRGITSSRSL